MENFIASPQMVGSSFISSVLDRVVTVVVLLFKCRIVLSRIIIYSSVCQQQQTNLSIDPSASCSLLLFLDIET
jgi:hypothetical protein